jgi:hypothetical protein
LYSVCRQGCGSTLRRDHAASKFSVAGSIFSTVWKLVFADVVVGQGRLYGCEYVIGFECSVVKSALIAQKVLLG